MDIVDPAVAAYLTDLYDDGDAVRQAMERLGAERKFPIVGPLVGRHLQHLALSSGAKRVFELGSGFGYSALHFARGVGPDGVVHCTDLDADNVATAQRFLTEAGVWPRIVYHQEEATAALRRTGGTWDIVYCDIDKDGYPDTVDLAYTHLRPGGLFVTDNVLWSGRVLAGRDDGSPATRGVLEFTRRLFQHPGFFTRIDPTRDGLAVALRRA